jgi:predicted DNA-binding antitoxin AbrB/MazE fold protein
MGGTVRARVKGSVLELLEKIDLPEGAEVTVSIIEAHSGNDREAFRRAAGAWKETVDAEALIRNIDADRLITRRPEPRL